MKSFFTLYLLLFTVVASAQELNCNVIVNSSRIQGSNKDIFTTLQEGISDFMNNTSWSTQIFEAGERIECNLTLDIAEQLPGDEFKAKLQIQVRRPVYGSSYNSVILNYVDNDIQFKYQQFDPINVSENTYISNLSSLLSFYAYIILGLDSDTFSLLGGDAFYRKAEQIVNAAQSAPTIGWQARDNQKRKNRYWLVDNLLSSEYEPLRNFYYTYHRQGLDLMEKSVERGRLGVTESISILERFSKNKPDPFTYLFSIILETKSDEIVNIYQEAPQPEKLKIKSTLMSIDPAGARKYGSLE